jgi:hypothetical protein
MKPTQANENWWGSLTRRVPTRWGRPLGASSQWASREADIGRHISEQSVLLAQVRLMNRSRCYNCTGCGFASLKLDPPKLCCGLLAGSGQCGNGDTPIAATHDALFSESCCTTPCQSLLTRGSSGRLSTRNDHRYRRLLEIHGQSLVRLSIALHAKEALMSPLTKPTASFRFGALRGILAWENLRSCTLAMGPMLCSSDLI